MLSTAGFWGAVLRLGISRAAMFAEPAITNSEEVIRLIHSEEKNRRQKIEFRTQESEVRKGVGSAF